MPLQISESDEGGAKVYKFAGQIDEDANFSSNPLASTQLIMDFEGVTLINSCGIREWIKWMNTASGSKILYRNCPKVIVDQINMVEGFLPANGIVESFYVPYYCEECENITQVLLKNGKDFGNGGVKAPEENPCTKCQSAAEIDVIEGKYFKFLQRAA